MIPVTKPFLPPIEEYESYLSDIWKRNWLTNNGPLVNDLEHKLKEYLNLKHLLFVSNGTIAIQLAIKALELKGKIITTPFSYVATTSSIIWENCQPVFADIDPKTLNIDPERIEANITPDTCAILATHVYGNPCDVETIDEIAKRNRLKVIYDGAHAFGVQYKGKSIFEWGDISTCSFHATKLFHTVEGGTVITNDPELLMKLAFLRNFGHDGFDKFAMLGINGKNSELHAAMGLINLKYVDKLISTRRVICNHYNDLLNASDCTTPEITQGSNYNFAYYPVIFNSEELLLKVISALNENFIFPRRYFYPTLETLPYLDGKVKCKIAESIAKRVLCLPLYDSLAIDEVGRICDIISTTLNKR